MLNIGTGGGGLQLEQTKIFQFASNNFCFGAMGVAGNHFYLRTRVKCLFLKSPQNWSFSNLNLPVILLPNIEIK